MVSGAAVVAGFPALPDWLRAALAGMTAVLAGVAAALQSWRHDDEADAAGLVARQDTEHAAAAPQPQLLPKPAPFQLPPDPVNFTNQEQAIRRVTATATKQRAVNSGPAVCVISGKGGVGKTALAIRVAHVIKPDFAAGQLYVNLHGIEERPLDASEVLEEFLRDLGVQPSLIPRRLEERARIYRSKLAAGRFLVLLDNAASEPQVRPLIPWESGCTVLVTSRGQLPGLESVQHVPLEVLEPDAALRLLGGIVGQARLDAEPEAARSIVRLCGYLPLAVKVAGAKLAARPHWRLSKLLERLQDEQARLGELRVGDLEVRSVLAMSYNTRTDRERQAFRRLGLLRMTSFPAWAVAALLEDGLRETEDLLESLAQAQLVEVAGTDVAGQLHYRLHDLLRDFARERALQEESLPDDPVEWFSFERANLAVIIQQAFEADLATLGWALLARLSPFFQHQAYWTTWREAAQTALDAATQSGNRRAQAAASYELGWVARFQGRFAASIQQLRSSLSIFAELDDQAGKAKALSALGVVLHDAGQWRQAVAALEEALALLRQLGDRRGQARTRLELGVIYRLQGDWRRALELLEAALVLFRQLGDRYWEACTLRALADLHLEQGRLDDALAALESVRHVFEQLGDRRWTTTTGMRIGEVYARQGRLDEALAVFDRVGPVLQELGDRRWAAMTTLRRGEVRARQGHLDEALTALEQARGVFRETGDRRFQAITTASLGTLRAQQGQLQDALAAFDQAIPVFEELGDRLRLAETLRDRGKARATGGERALAAGDLRAALSLFQTLERPDDAQQLRAELARLDPDGA